MAQCNTCAGFGTVGGEPCRSCGGTGQVPEYHSGPGGRKDDNSCFPGHTKIKTPTGLRRIDSLKNGEMVVSIGKYGQLRHSEIMHVAKHANASTMLIKTESKFLEVTGIHSIQTSRGWLKANKIRIGDDLVGLSSDKELSKDKVVSIGYSKTICPVYNIIVSGDFTFVANGYVAHSFTYFRTLRVFLYNFVYSLSKALSKNKVANQKYA